MGHSMRPPTPQHPPNAPLSPTNGPITPMGLNAPPQSSPTAPKGARMGHPMGPPTPQHPTVTHEWSHSTIGLNAPPPRAAPQHPKGPLWAPPHPTAPHSAPQSPVDLHPSPRRSPTAPTRPLKGPYGSPQVCKCPTAPHCAPLRPQTPTDPPPNRLTASRHARDRKRRGRNNERPEVGGEERRGEGPYWAGTIEMEVLRWRTAGLRGVWGDVGRGCGDLWGLWGSMGCVGIYRSSGDPRGLWGPMGAVGTHGVCRDLWGV